MAVSYDMEATPLRPQHHGCLNKPCTVTAPVDMAVWTGEISQGLHALRKSYRQLIAAERGGLSFLQGCTHIQSHELSPNHAHIRGVLSGLSSHICVTINKKRRQEGLGTHGRIL